MQLQNSFVVSSPVDKAWDFFLDVENIVPCMPGAELVETVDDKNWRGRLKIKFGPVAMAFEGTVEMVERDDAERRMMLRGAGKDQRGAATRRPTSTWWSSPARSRTPRRCRCSRTSR